MKDIIKVPIFKVLFSITIGILLLTISFAIVDNDHVLTPTLGSITFLVLLFTLFIMLAYAD